jgi:hypothetical protein
MSAWDDMLVSKAHPGQHNVTYVAGMNCTNLPTSTFSVSNSLAGSYMYGQAGTHPLGTGEYTLLMWSSSCTAFTGDGATGNITAADRLGGMVIL